MARSWWIAILVALVMTTKSAVALGMYDTVTLTKPRERGGGGGGGGGGQRTLVRRGREGDRQVQEEDDDDQAASLGRSTVDFGERVDWVATGSNDRRLDNHGQSRGRIVVDSSSRAKAANYLRKVGVIAPVEGVNDQGLWGNDDQLREEKEREEEEEEEEEEVRIQNFEVYDSEESEDGGKESETLLLLGRNRGGEDVTCPEPYGFLPCSKNVGGNLFLMGAYGAIVLYAARFISKGSDLLLRVLSPGLIGGLILPVLGAFPDSLLILASGVGGDRETAQKQVSVGVGVLAGSIVVLMTIGWAGFVIAGRCDLTGPRGEAQEKKLAVPWSLTRTGVTVDDDTRVGAGIMILTCLPYVVLQLPLMAGKREEKERAADAMALVLAWVGFGAYCVYQVTNPWLQKKRIRQARINWLRDEFLRGIAEHSITYGGLVKPNGRPNRYAIERLFDAADSDKDGQLNMAEMKALLLGLAPDLMKTDASERVSALFASMDRDMDRLTKKDEFVSAIVSFIDTKRTFDRVDAVNLGRTSYWRTQSERARERYAELRQEEGAGGGGDADEEDDMMMEVTDGDTEDEEGGEGDGGHEEERRENEDGGGGGEDFRADGTDASTERERRMSKKRDNKKKTRMTPAQVYSWASWYMLLGTTLVAIFAGPLVSSISAFSRASGIPRFFVAFVVAPIASSSSELVSSFNFATRKRKRSISLALGQAYGSVAMNNTLCLAIFLTLIYVRHLSWEFSSESLVILITVVVVGLIGYSRKTVSSLTAVMVLMLYPLSIAVVYYCDKRLGWR